MRNPAPRPSNIASDVHITMVSLDGTDDAWASQGAPQGRVYRKVVQGEGAV